MAPMLHDAPLDESRAWYEASDEAWAGFAVAVYNAAVNRREDDPEGSPSSLRP